MPIDFYLTSGSPPCGAVLLLAKAIGVDLNLKNIDMMKGEHLTPEFVKLNPQHTVPTLNDNGFVLWESRAIMTYLIEQYAKNDSLYPKDIKKRALINQRLQFDIGTFYARLADYYYPALFGNSSLDPAKYTKIEDAFKVLEAILQSSEYVVGNTLTVADLSIAVSVSTYEVMKFPINNYPHVAKWYAKVKNTTPGYEETNGKNALILKQYVDMQEKK